MIDKPALMISSADDWFFMRGSTDGLEQLLPQIEKHEIPDAAHSIQQEKPDEVNALLVALAAAQLLLTDLDGQGRGRHRRRLGDRRGDLRAARRRRRPRRGDRPRRERRGADREARRRGPRAWSPTSATAPRSTPPLAQVEAELGPVDVWVNNAGISGGAHSDRVNPRAEQQLAELAPAKR